MRCVTKANVFVFEIAPIKVIASKGKQSDRVIEFKIVLGCI